MTAREDSTLATEVQRLEAQAERCAARHRTMRLRYGRVHWFIGLPAAGLAAAAGTTALTADSAALTALIAFSAAALAAVQGLTRPAEREESHRRRMAAYASLADSARILHSLELADLSHEAGVARLKELNAQFRALEGQATFSAH